jgi:hypothetical protein
MHQLHYDGHAWTSTMTPGLSNFWGISAQDIYATGPAGQPYHFDGSTWSAVSGPTGFQCFRFWASAPANVYCSAGSQSLWHFDGASWMSIALPTNACGDDQDRIRPLWGVSANDILAVGGFRQIFEFSGAGWQEYHACGANSDDGFWNGAWGIGSEAYMVGLGSGASHGTK